MSERKRVPCWVPTVSIRGERVSSAAMTVGHWRGELLEASRKFAAFEIEIKSMPVESITDETRLTRERREDDVIKAAMILAAWSQTLERCRKRDRKRGAS